MKKAIVLFSAVLSLAIYACGNSSTGNSTGALDTTKLTKGQIFYQCEMDPEITSDKAGSCPKCGMDLTRMEKK